MNRVGFQNPSGTSLSLQYFTRCVVPKGRIGGAILSTNCCANFFNLFLCEISSNWSLVTNNLLKKSNKAQIKWTAPQKRFHACVYSKNNRLNGIIKLN